MFVSYYISLLLFFHNTAPTDIYTLSLHDALPICLAVAEAMASGVPVVASDRGSIPELLVDGEGGFLCDPARPELFVDRKSTRLNSSHVEISYAVFCLKKKSKDQGRRTERSVSVER